MRTQQIAHKLFEPPPRGKLPFNSILPALILYGIVLRRMGCCVLRHASSSFFVKFLFKPMNTGVEIVRQWKRLASIFVVIIYDQMAGKCGPDNPTVTTLYQVPASVLFDACGCALCCVLRFYASCHRRTCVHHAAPSANQRG